MIESIEDLKTNTPEIDWKWDKATYNPYWHEAIYGVLERNIPSGSKVLEVGAGGSHSLAALAGRHQCRAFGIEPDETGLLKTRYFATLEDSVVQLVRGDGFRLPFSKGEFDVVYSQGVVEHFAVEQTRLLLEEHARVCRPAGLVIVSVPNFLNFPNTLRKYIRGSKFEYYPERSYTPGGLRKSLVEVGLDVVDVDGVMPLMVFGGIPGWWRVLVVLQRLRLLNRINFMKNPVWRSRVGYMTYAIAKKPSAS